MEVFRLFRVGLNLFFMTLPLILISICTFFGVALGNLGMIMLVVGQAVIVPAAVYILHIITRLFGDYSMKLSSDLGQLVTSEVYLDPKFNVAPSFWISHVVFFLSYLFSNALDVYSLPPVTDTPAEEWRVENRKARASMIMGVSVFMLIFLVLMRLLVTDLETKFGVLVGLASMIPLGYGWYTVAKLAGARKLDIFGIVQQMVPVTDDKSITYCVPPS